MRRHFQHNLGELAGIFDMNDQRVIGGPTLCLEDLSNCCGIKKIGTQAINGLGRKGDYAASPYKASRYLRIIRDNSIHRRSALGLSVDRRFPADLCRSTGLSGRLRHSIFQTGFHFAANFNSFSFAETTSQSAVWAKSSAKTDGEQRLLSGRTGISRIHKPCRQFEKAKKGAIKCSRQSVS